jgi:hypothetical protein
VKSHTSEQAVFGGGGRGPARRIRLRSERVNFNGDGWTPKSLTIKGSLSKMIDSLRVTSFEGHSLAIIFLRDQKDTLQKWLK